MSEISRTAKKNLKTAFASVSNKFSADADTQPHMSAAAFQVAVELTASFNAMTPEQQEAVSSVLCELKAAVRTAGYKRLFGLTLPIFSANLEVGPPTE